MHLKHSFKVRTRNVALQIQKFASVTPTSGRFGLSKTGAESDCDLHLARVNEPIVMLKPKS